MQERETSLLLQKFSERDISPSLLDSLNSWQIETLETEQEVVARFREVRDMPFEITRFDRKMGCNDLVEHMRIARRGACSAKHYLLGAEYENLGVKTLYISYPFLWQELEVDYPQQLKELAKHMPLQYHLALSVFFGNKLNLLDATWDSGLEQAGFIINNISNGIEQTTPAVPPAGGPIFHHSGQDRWDFIEKIKKSMESTGVEPQFYSALNEWLEGLRTNKQ